MELDHEGVKIGRLTRDGALVGYLVVDTQQWATISGRWFRRRRVREPRRRYRLAFEPFDLDGWDEGFLEPEDEGELEAGRFTFKGEVLTYEELVGAERDAAFARFSQWD